MGLAFRHPDIGEMVGDYKIVEVLGSGGLGIVFKAERAGRFFALKFLLLPKFTGRAKREISILVRLEHPCVVRFIGSDFWPDPVMGHPYIVMEFVDGQTLEQFTLQHNPSARWAARVILDAALTLGEVHKEGVYHRDLKPSNIIIRGKGERPILIDFGVGTLVGAALITGTSLPPGTVEFRAPEPLRFQSENPDSERGYEYGPSDELWALGVTLYWLLTDVLPFGDRDDGGVDKLHERILTQRPIAPHLLNPRVPLALSNVCMKMLEEKPESRHQHIGSVCVALDNAMNDAKQDASWDLPLFDPSATHNKTTDEDAALRGQDELMRVLQRWMKHSPRRGRTPAKVEPSPAPLPGPVDNPRPTVEASPETIQKALAAEQDQISTVDAPLPAPAEQDQISTVDAPPTAPKMKPPPERPEPPAVPMAALASQPSRAPLPRALVAAVLSVAVVGLFVGAAVLRPVPLQAPAPVPAMEGQAAALPLTSPRVHPTSQGVAGREVARAAKPLESLTGDGAAPARAQPPAPTSTAMLRKPNAKEKPAPQSQATASGCIPVLKRVCTAGVCSLMLTGCPGPSSQVRPTPEPEACPPGAVEAMKKLGFMGWSPDTLRLGEQGRLTVQEGPISGRLTDDLGGLPAGSVLHGRLIVRESRVYGRFTLAEKPNGDTFPVCLQMTSASGPGVPRSDEGGGASAAIANYPQLETVERFE